MLTFRFYFIKRDFLGILKFDSWYFLNHWEFSWVIYLVWKIWSVANWNQKLIGVPVFLLCVAPFWKRPFYTTIGPRLYIFSVTTQDSIHISKCNWTPPFPSSHQNVTKSSLEREKNPRPPTILILGLGFWAWLLTNQFSTWQSHTILDERN